jgi:hypothetical protein
MKWITLALLGSPFASANAALIQDEINVVDIEIWGTITEVVGGDGDWMVGDGFHRTLRIHLESAPPDSSSGEAGSYRWNQPCDRFCPPPGPTTSFVSTVGKSVVGFSEDHVSLRSFRPSDAFPNGADAFTVSDRETWAWEDPARGLSGTNAFEFTFDFSTPYDLLEGDSLIQQFDHRFTPDEQVGGGLAGAIPPRGAIGWLVEGVQSGVRFIADRVRATPRVCRA